MLHLDTLGDDPDIDTLVANDPEFHQPDRGRQRESRAVFTDRRIVGPHPAREGTARVDSGGRRHPDVREHRAIATAIRDRQPAIARAWATAHVAGVETWLRHSLADPDSPAGLGSVVPTACLTIPA